jgi:hypothetical protein
MVTQLGIALFINSMGISFFGWKKGTSQNISQYLMSRGFQMPISLLNQSLRNFHGKPCTYGCVREIIMPVFAAIPWKVSSLYAKS